MWSNEVSKQVTDAIIMVKNIIKTAGVVQSTVLYILKKKEQHQMPGRPWKTAKVNDGRILSLVKKNLFTTSFQVKNIPEEVDMS